MADKVAAEWSAGFGEIAKHQKELRDGYGFIHKRLPRDSVTSKVIPIGLTIVGGAVLVKGLYNM